MPPPSRAGLSLLESAAVLSVSGVLLAAFVPTFVDHVRLSKISEATEQLDSFHRAAAAYYARDQRVAGKLVHGCLPDSVGPMPAAPSVDPVSVDFLADPRQSAMWSALGAREPLSLRYAYSVLVAMPGCGPRDMQRGSVLVTFRAEGDLDGDGVRSVLERSATASADQRTLVALPPLRITNRVE